MASFSRLKLLAPAIAVACHWGIASPTAQAGTVVGSGSFTGSESVMSPRFLRPGAPGNTCSTTGSGNYQYRAYQIHSNGTGQLNASVNVGNCGINGHVTFHQGGFDPANICAGFAWSYGSPVSYSNQVFSVTPNSTITMVVSGAVNAPDVVCGPFSWVISGTTSQNIFMRRLKVTNSATPGLDAWQASYVYNDDRSDANRFNPSTDGFSANFAGRVIWVAADSFKQLPSGVFTYKSPAGAEPSYTVKITPSKQTIDVKVSKIDDFGVDLPGNSFTSEVRLGEESFLFDITMSSTGTYVPLVAYPQDNFAVATASLKNTTVKDKASFTAKMYLESPNLFPDMMFADCKDKCNQPTATLRLKEGSTTLLEKNLTGLVYATMAKDVKTGLPVYTIKKIGKDSSLENVLNAISYSNKTGAFNIALGKVNLLAAVTPYQAPLTVELELDGYTFRTTVTMFAADAGNKTYNSTFSRVSPL